MPLLLFLANAMIGSLREKCPYSEFFWSIFSLIRTEYGEILRISPYSVRMWENTGMKKSECGHFSLRASLRMLKLKVHCNSRGT